MQNGEQASVSLCSCCLPGFVSSVFTSLLFMASAPSVQGIQLRVNTITAIMNAKIFIVAKIAVFVAKKIAYQSKITLWLQKIQTGEVFHLSV